ncbi:pirin family protein [Xylophilus rhododendri]|uniref:Pirin family protein n=1 Tax=Xylophilus rhododendri TaxID=2697032 RepID=A0A857J520_9BURK|nr:pirin-like C-terminal cupin domain-containing protein [Xylophilus rhododendri]QHI98787.1 pirin family protein [Xylophilus rhododendri]
MSVTDTSAPTLPAVLALRPLGAPPWETADPFLFCVHHDDEYPRANGRMGPDASLAGRAIGQDFSRKDGWSMYHGQQVPGFPGHPHRGFETVTIVRRGLIDHADSLGAAARFGRGDVQWLTAGDGVVHSEMFPLLDDAQPNPLELFQIWLNLPAKSKRSPAHFTMFWGPDIPSLIATDAAGRKTGISVIAGHLDGAAEPLAPPPDSWAAQADADVAIWTLRLEPGARWTLPAAKAGINRRLYFFAGQGLQIEGQRVDRHAVAELRPDASPELVNTGDEVIECLLLQGRPIGEPVVQYGPFVMNSQAEIAQTMADFRRTGFGGWPWPDDSPTHGRDPARFAVHVGGRRETPPEA